MAALLFSQYQFELSAFPRTNGKSRRDGHIE
jgi:hypothetical protein